MIREELTNRHKEIESLIEKLFEKEKQINSYSFKTKNKKEQLNSDLTNVINEETVINDKIKQINELNQLNYKLINPIENQISESKRINKLFANCKQIPLSIYMDFDRLDNKIEDKINENGRNKEKHQKYINNIDHKIKLQSNEAKLIYESLTKSFNNDSTLQSEFQDYLKEKNEKEDPSSLLIFTQDTIDEFKRNIFILKSNESDYLKLTSNQDFIQLNDSSPNVSFEDKHNKTFNIGSLNTPIFKGDLSFEPKSSSNLSKSCEKINVNYNRTYYLIKSKKMQDRLKNAKEIAIEDLGGSKCCHKLRSNYDNDIQKSEREKKTRSVSNRKK